jgi:hypothetical protein
MSLPSRSEEERHGQGEITMPARDIRCHLGKNLLVMLALGIPCSVAGCGGADSSKPAPITAEQGKKAQAYMSNYRQQMTDANKAKAKAEGNKAP